MEFIRGDTFAFKFLVTFEDGTPITKSDLETLFITVRKRPNKTSPILFEKTLDDVEIDDKGYCHARFEPQNTEELFYGSYFFDIELTTNSGYRKSKLMEFKITKETTIHGSGDKVGS